YQGRVMTSAVDTAGKSFGWINRDFIAAGKTGTQFDNYGGEDRFWLGPEGGQFGLYFPPGKAFSFDAWQVPAGLQEGAWEMTEATPARAVFKHTIAVTNWSGTPFTRTRASSSSPATASSEARSASDRRAPSRCSAATAHRRSSSPSCSTTNRRRARRRTSTACGSSRRLPTRATS